MANHHRTSLFWSIYLVFVAAVVCTASAALAQESAYRVDAIAVTGEPAPGTGGLNFGCFDPSAIDLSDTGIVAFLASTDLCDPNSGILSSDHAVWVGTLDSLTLAARRGDAAPGATAQTFTEISGAFVNDSGDLAIHASLDASGYAPNNGVWIRSAGNLSLLAMTGDAAPGAGGLSFSSVGLDGYNDLGIASLWANVGDEFSSRSGIWRGAPGSLDPVVLSGDLAPGSGGQYFDFIGLTSVSSNSVAFWATTTDPDPSRAEGIWSADSTGINLVTRLGDLAPATSGRVFRAFQGYGLIPPPTGQEGDLDSGLLDTFVANTTGDVAFTAYVDPLDPADMYSDAGIWIGGAGGLGLVALTGEIAPGADGAPFRYFNHLNFNAAGQVAFDASLDIADPTTDHGIWAGAPGSLNLVVREGDPAPGTLGETFGSLVMGPSLNDSGELGFFARLRESGTDGIWAAAADGSVSLIAREGDTVLVDNGDYRTLQSINPIYGGMGGYSYFSVFNGTGYLAFTATFTDGTDALLLASPVSTSPNQPPAADAGVDQTIAENNTAVLDGTASYDPDGTILNFLWTLDGVEIGSEPKVTIGPLAIGVHTATLTVTDRSGATVSDQMTLTVFANLPPVADAGPDETINYTQSVTLDGTGSSDPEGGALSYFWDFGCWSTAGASGGSSTTCLNATGPNPIIGPLDPGVYNGLLTVTDIHGASAADEVILTVINNPPVAEAGLDQTIQTLETVALDGSSSSDSENDLVSYAWSIGGVQIAEGPSPVAGPFDAGVHTVTLTVTDGRGATATDQIVLTVLNRAPSADAGLDQTANHTQTVTLTGSGTDPEGGPLAFAWTLDGVQIATGASATVGPFDVGVHNITLTVTDDHGASATDSMVVNVVNGAPVASAGPDQTVNHAQVVPLDASGSYDPEGGVLTYAWTVDGVQIATGASATVGPFDVGVHNITLTVTDDHGATATDSMVITVVNEAPVADAGPDQTFGVKGKSTTVTLDGSASSDPEGGVLTYLWTIDGQTVGTEALLQIELPVGVHSFTLTVTDDHGATAFDTVVVTAVKGNV